MAFSAKRLRPTLHSREIAAINPRRAPEFRRWVFSNIKQVKEVN